MCGSAAGREQRSEAERRQWCTTKLTAKKRRADRAGAYMLLWKGAQWLSASDGCGRDKWHQCEVSTRVRRRKEGGGWGRLRISPPTINWLRHRHGPQLHHSWAQTRDEPLPPSHLAFCLCQALNASETTSDCLETKQSRMSMWNGTYFRQGWKYKFVLFCNWCRWQCRQSGYYRSDAKQTGLT